MTVAAPRQVADADLGLPVTRPYDLRRTLAIHRRGPADPAMRFEVSGSTWRTSRTPDGPVTLLLEDRDGEVRARAWGPGSAWAIDRLPGLLGLDDDPAGLVPRHPAVEQAVRRAPGLRIGRTERVLEALVPAILEQKVTGDEARRVYRALLARHGEPAPGGFGMRVPPAPRTLAELPYYAFHPLGLERRRAELIRAVCREADRLERLGAAAAQPATDPTAIATREQARAAAAAALRGFPGIGPWTVAEVAIRAWGDPDAVSVGDFHIPSMVAWALAGEPRGTDERMLELLEPYAGQRGRVTRVLELAGVAAPRYGPRLASRRIAGL